MAQLQEKVAVATGSSGGIGYSIVRGFARRRVLRSASRT